jgi:hypothetical protein
LTVFKHLLKYRIISKPYWIRRNIMYIDNLTVAGIAIASAYLFLPLLFRRELLAVEPDAPAPPAGNRDTALILQSCSDT